jgi:hypothetical protein
MFIPLHLRLKERRALVARAIFYEMMERHWPNYQSQDDQGLRLNFLKKADEELEAEGDIRLDIRLKSIVKEVEAGLEGLTGGKIAPKVRDAIGHLKSNVSRISCDLCSNGEVCNSRYRDDRIVASGGHCLANFKTLYEFSSEVTSAYYTKHSPCFHDVVKPEIVFASRLYRGGRPHDIPSPVCIGAATSYIERGELAYSEVAISFHIPGFDWKSMLVTLYALLHEFICHVYSGIDPHGPFGRRDPIEYDTFAEGWMDRVVSTILDDLAEHRGPANNIAPPVELSPFIMEGREFQGVRRDCRRDDRSATASLIASGFRVAEAVERVFKRVSRSDEAARALFLEISFAYNLLNSSVRDRNAFVAKLERLHEEDSPLYRPCAQALEGYAQRKNLPELLARLTAL